MEDLQFDDFQPIEGKNFEVKILDETPTNSPGKSYFFFREIMLIFYTLQIILFLLLQIEEINY